MGNITLNYCMVYYYANLRFSDIMSISFTTVNRWETAKARPNLSAMKELKAFCVEQQIEYAPVENAWISSKVKED